MKDAVFSLEKDPKSLKLFILKADSLLKLKLVKDGFSSEIKIRWDVKQYRGVQIIGPDEEYFRSFLLTFRSFISEKEPIEINRIYNICKRLAEGETKDRLIKAHKEFKLLRTNADFGFKYQGKEVIPSYVIDLYMNGKYFHVDENKHEFLETLGQFEKALFKQLLMSYVISVLGHIKYLHSICRKLSNPSAQKEKT